ncbi:MAG: SMP-30/gluconolactonase/LRE family protein [Phycisphaerales bacterium JB040]
MPGPELALDARCALGEGPVWHEGALWFVNIPGGELHRFEPASGAHEVRTLLDGFLSSAIPCTDGHWLVSVQDGFALYDWANDRLEPIRGLDDPDPGNRFNDAKADPSGRVWAGTMSTRGVRDNAALYRLDHDHTLRAMVSPVTLSNGMAWSADASRMYYIDTPTRRVDVFDFDAEAPEPHTPVRNRRTLIEFGALEGSPDGMTIDRDDNLWVALWGGSRVVHVNGHTGERLGDVGLPASQVTSCCFGGSDLEVLFITTARAGLSDERLAAEPHAGGVFRLVPGVGGRPADLFGLRADR